MKNKYPYLSNYLELVKEIHPSKNENIDVSKIKRGTAKKLWWVCKFKHEWEAMVLDRTRGSGCPFCSGRIATAENCLAVVNPKLAEQWHSTKNVIQPNQILPSSGKKFWWKCKLGHEWEATLDKRTKGQGCPFCKRRKPSVEINLEILYPNIALEWNYEKNNGLKPSEVLPKSTKVVWWVCSKGHEYQSKVYARTSLKEHGCNICSGHVINKTNCLATVRPEIAMEWHPIKNGDLTPNDVSKASMRKVWWKCSKFPNHEWKTVINSRTCNLTCGCPYCNSSKGEKLIQEWLSNNKIVFNRQFKFDDCIHKNKLPFDFAVFPNDKPMFIIEFHGEQHYKPIAFFGGQEKFKERVKLDLIKKEFCNKTNIELLIIPYWDKRKISEILNKVLNN